MRRRICQLGKECGYGAGRPKHPTNKALMNEFKTYTFSHTNPSEAVELVSQSSLVQATAFEPRIYIRVVLMVESNLESLGIQRYCTAEECSQS